MTAKTTKSRPCYIFFILVCAIIIPVILSIIFYNFHKKNNNIDETLQTSAKTISLAVNLAKPSYKWQLVYVSSQICDSDCNNIIKSLFHIKRALGKQSENVKIQHVFPDLIKGMQDIKDFTVTNKIYLINPQDISIVYYADTQDPMTILQDLTNILYKNS